ncbi:MAG TPA: L,D-transpeptidase family protein [Acidimicrobiia bacterium]|nr:L,D-transpeptidase family protein [Acidimicrobiia bacterium]
MEPDESSTTDEIDRPTRLAQRRGSLRRHALVTTVLIVVAAAGGAGAYAVVENTRNSGAAAASPTSSTLTSTTTRATTTTTVPRTTTTTIPAIKQPKDQLLPDPGRGIGQGSRGPSVFVYEARMKELHFDPGHVDDYFDQDTRYAVETVQKYFGLPRTGTIDSGVDLALTHFHYMPAQPDSEADRVEIDLDKQVLTLFKNWQPQLLTTTSTGSGEHFCGGVDGCQYAITPTGHFHFYDLIRGWQKGKLGTMWNPYYFNGSDAVHGLASVPTYPASHGCARIPMHIADYFYSLVHQGESVFVVGTPKQAGSGYIGPAPTTPAPATTASSAPPAPVVTTTPTTAKKHTTTTVATTGTTKPHTTTTKP